ncbi:Vancomycin resistance protein YoaR, contains peptidoglycan-binding and VanW domains [Pseudobutyrivibrio ruminis]|uniref:Vancomycin resistance protein YoaR, contains peptidoglycan-binding and VanW domains n=1 Tax=Pseudobutyrivibrio ruminis TaxID=46206 RepID=A0A1H7L7B6_9FIRM|nr:VanW family protein [Pseudobutyrivibrio ruminis]SEK94838.1 Vancomycin resistance protein YoaR, contains peptidoglycan-binding and VanW domains [Pseudobutyrivibrio ruminis]
MNRKNILPILLAASMVSGLFANTTFVQADEIEESEASVSDEELANEEAESAVADETDDRIIPDGITIEGISVGGMTVTEADTVVADYFSQYDDVEFTLSANDQTISATGADLCIGAKNSDVTVKAATYGSYGNFGERFKASQDLAEGRTKDFALSLGVDKDGVILYLNSASTQVNDEASDDYLTRENGEFVFHEGTSGVVVQIEESAAIIVDYIENSWDGSAATIALATEVKEPRGSKEELAEITDLLGSYSTDYSSSSAARKNNVANGVGFINGTILYPGDEFSVLNTITPFSAENGYMLAGSYENGTTVETYGGGICQVSTTLYGAVREAELEVITRSCHSMIVTYVPPSQDAAIAESGGKDFQIRNNKNYPIYIEGYCDGSNAYFSIYGKEEDDAGHSVEYETEITGVNVQATTWVADPNVPLGKMTTTVSGHTGYTARLWKIVYENGEEVSRDVYNNSRYNPSNRTVTVGIASADPNLSYAMLQAVNTQDAATIAAAISIYAPGVVNSTPFEITPKYSVTNPTTDTTTDNTTNPTTDTTTDTTVTDNSEI